MAGRLFAAIFGMFLGLALLKFGTPAVMDKFVESPSKGIEWLVFVWPLRLAYPMVGLLALAGPFAFQWRYFAPRWLMFMPLVWLAWQFISATQSVEAQLSQATLAHFAVCVVCFYLGALCTGGGGSRSFLLGPLAGALGLMLYVGFEQHFGGLEETRKYFWAEVYPTLPNVPPEYVKKMESNRIFSTVFYPNAFAGALLLLLPPLLAWVWQAKEKFTAGARGLLCGLMVAGAAACLYWSGSKGGWLLALAIGLVALWHQAISRRLKVVLLCVLIICGGAGFYWKNRAYMERGATSVVARFDYWRAAWQTALARPVFGSGPGTFGNAYQAIKKPESEMARLAHNDYLQQASDSGFPGLIAYVVFIGGMLWVGYRRLNWKGSPVVCGVWLGLLAWTAQSSFEFTLYVPSLAWTAFALMGWLLGSSRETIRQNPSPAPNLSSR
ncbi:MAG: O-antigen ligase family protein [Verrucomicrobia bacterium]|nr:O-antigen ligase family protein [Verrucomicrobiota bacterium]